MEDHEVYAGRERDEHKHEALHARVCARSRGGRDRDRERVRRQDFGQLAARVSRAQLRARSSSSRAA